MIAQAVSVSAAELLTVLARSLVISGLATLLATGVGVPIGFLLGTRNLPGRRVLLAAVHAGMGLPTVLVGLAAILLLGREGLFGGLDLLFTPTAMVLAQAVIAIPIVVGLSVSAVQAVPTGLVLQVRAMGATRIQEARWLIREARLGVLAAVMAGFGAAASEVGAALMVGGNLRGYTRVLTTATLLEARMGRYETAIGLALLLLMLAFLVTGALTWLQQRGSQPIARSPAPGAPWFPARVEPVPDTDAVLTARNLERRYGDRVVLAVERLDVAPGESLALLGPNGAGKSTLLRQLALLDRPDAGSVLLEGRPLSSVADLYRARRNIALVQQDPPMLAGSVLENVEAPLRVRGVSEADRRRRAHSWLARMGVEGLAGRAARTLSGGEQRRVALARALVSEPTVLLLDEPFVSLDPPTRDQLLDVVREVVRTDRRTTVLVTQERDEALRLATRLGVLWNGALVQVGTPERVLEKPVSPETARFLGTDTVVAGEVLSARDGVVRVAVGRLELDVASDDEVSGRVWLCIRPDHVILQAATAEPAGAPRNVFPGTVEGVEPRGRHMEVRVRIPAEGSGLALAAAMTRPTVAELALAPGASVVASIKATAIHLIPVG